MHVSSVNVCVHACLCISLWEEMAVGSCLDDCTGESAACRVSKLVFH